MQPLYDEKSGQPAVDARRSPESTPAYEPPVIEKLGHWQVVTLSGSLLILPGSSS